MNEDRILEMFFDKARWQYAIEKGLFKDMNKAVMYQLTEPKARLAMYQRIKSGNYKIMPPHTAKIPKDNGDFRTVYVNEPVDRILLSIANDLLFELMPEMVHPRCTSYQKGIGCGCVVQEVSRIIYSAEGKIIGWKGDFSKYFDSVPIRFIDWAFDKVEEKYGKSALIDEQEAQASRMGHQAIRCFYQCLQRFWFLLHDEKPHHVPRSQILEKRTEDVRSQLVEGA